MKNPGTFLFLVFPFLASALHAASIVVTNTDDAGAGSLRQALADAAAFPGADEITFAPGLSGQSIALSGVANTVGATALVISDADGVTVDATALPGGLTLHDGAGTGYRAFLVNEGSSLTLRGLSLSGFTAQAGRVGGAILNSGTLTLTQCALSGNSAAAGGGAIYSGRGTLSLTQCSLTGNSTGSYGGAIRSQIGALSLKQCSFSGNSASEIGGAIYQTTDSVTTGTLTQCSLSGNSAATYGGAIFNYGRLTLTDCSLYGNTAGNSGGSGGAGGAIFSESRLTLNQCTLSANSAGFRGGAIYGSHSALILTQCTFSGNSGWPGDGGAIYNYFGFMRLTHCTLSGNSAGRAGGVANENSLTLQNTIVAGNTGGGGPDVVNLGFADDISALGVNFIGNPNSSGLSAGPNIITGVPMLAPLGNYGGATQTMALLPGSPARNAAAVLDPAITSDQRGFPIVGMPDIGAYEAGTITNFENFIWETLPAAATPEQHAAAFDFDADGASNLDEWLAGTHATDPGSILRPAATRSGDNLLISWPGITGRNYRVWQSDALSGWTLTPGQNVLTGTGSDLNFTVPIAGERRYFRVEAIVP